MKTDSVVCSVTYILITTVLTIKHYAENNHLALLITEGRHTKHILAYSLPENLIIVQLSCDSELYEQASTGALYEQTMTDR